MPHSTLHKNKYKTNLAILALIMAFVALVWAITMVKMSNTPETTTMPHMSNTGLSESSGGQSISAQE